MRFAQGSELDPAPSASFRNYLGILTDPSSVAVDLYDALGDIVVADGIPSHVSVGQFNFPYTLAEDAAQGLWRIVWKAVIDGVPAEPTDEYFEVVASGDIVVTSDFDRLRRMIGERIPVGKTDDDTFFTDEEIGDMLVQASGDFNRAAMFGWLAKMAEFAKLIDRNTSGADLPLSQMYKNAESMFKHYAKLVGEDAAYIMGRVVGRAINLRETNCSPVMTGSGTYRTELRSTTARRLLMQKAPELLEQDPTYPQSGQVAT